MKEILDIQESIIAANGNASLAKDLFTMLLNDLDVRLQQIEASFQANDMDALKEHIHKLYGATAYCIVPKLRSSTAELDEALKQENYSQLQTLVDVVLQEIQQLMSDGSTFIEKDW
jgi:two-component system sensor histidine kinase BarA